MSTANTLTATEAVALMRAGTLSVEEMARACLARVAERDAAVQAWAYLDPDHVIAQARALDAAPVKGPLHGVPVGVKDMMFTADMPTQQGSPIYEGAFPKLDAAPVMSLRAAGALIFGKTVTTEFASTIVGGKARNAHDPARTPGGSSSGSAAAVADYQVAIGLGTQTGGSTMRPASYNGVIAYKPTWNVVSREGLKVYSLTCDTLGIYARSIADLDLLADVYRIYDDVKPPAFAIAGAKIAVCRSPAWSKAEAATRDALALGTAILTEAGAEVTELELPAMFDDILQQHHIVLRHEGRSAFLNDYLAHGAQLKDEFKAIVENREGITLAQVRHAYDIAAQCRIAFDEIAGGFDAVLTPSATGEAPVGLGSTGDPSFNSMWTFLHTPVINVPGFKGPSGMPVGLSLTSARYTDRKLITVAAVVADLFKAKGNFPPA